MQEASCPRRDNLSGIQIPWQNSKFTISFFRIEGQDAPDRHRTPIGMLLRETLYPIENSSLHADCFPDSHTGPSLAL